MQTINLNFITKGVSEAEVTHFMTELRKLIEKEKFTNYPIIKFYSDWIVHPSKDRIPKEMVDVINKIDSFVPRDKNPFHFRGNLKSIIYIFELKSELVSILNYLNINTKILENAIIWRDFIDNLVQVLVNQPINKPTSNINKIMFLPSQPRSMILQIEFNDTRGTFTLMNKD